MAATCSSSPMSAASPTTLNPCCCKPSMVYASFCLSLSNKTTDAPSDAKRVPIPFPNPSAPPVTKATWPSNRLLILNYYHIYQLFLLCLTHLPQTTLPRAVAAPNHQHQALFLPT